MTVEGGQHVIEGDERVLIDSCASQANRQEMALLRARKDGRLNLSDVVIDLRNTADPRDELSSLEMPHRLGDAIIRDSNFSRATLANAQWCSIPKSQRRAARAKTSANGQAATGLSIGRAAGSMRPVATAEPGTCSCSPSLISPLRAQYFFAPRLLLCLLSGTRRRPAGPAP